MKKTKILIIAISVALFVMPGFLFAQSQVLLNTFGPEDSYIESSGWTLGTESYGTYVQAIGFIPEATGIISQYQIAVFRNTGENSLDAWLLSDNNNSPGELLEQFSFNVPDGSNDLMLFANSSIYPLLVTGTRYWLVVAPPDLENELFGWYRNAEIDGIYNAQSSTGPDGPWNVTEGDYAPTLKILGLQTGSFTDARDSHEYDWVKIGDQVWMAENLAFLPSVSPSADGSQTTDTDPYYYVYDYQGSIVSEAKATDNYATYGVLYNWTAAMAGVSSSSADPSGVQGVCPADWHLPSDAEWTTLTDYLGGEEVAGGKLKEIGITHWNPPNTGATNESGFTARAGGGRSYVNYNFNSMGIHAYLWSSTEGDNIEHATGRTLSLNDTEAVNVRYSKEAGHSVRCLSDQPTLTTTAASSITVNSATSGGNVANDGGTAVTARGVCWSTQANPTLQNNDGYTTDGSGTGSFTSNITGLTPNTTYYVRAYATNSSGTAYGDQINLTTLCPDIIITIDEISNQTRTGTSDGSIDITVAGGSGDYLYAWTGPDGYTSESDDIGDLYAGHYDLVVTDNQTSCTESIGLDIYNPLMVTNVSDGGMGSLRNAIEYANSNNPTITDRIIFNIQGDGPHILHPESAFPTIIQPVIIEGLSQEDSKPNTSAPGSGLNSELMIEIDGTGAGNTSCFIIRTDHCTINGFVINRFAINGVEISGPLATDNTIHDNYIGTNTAGDSRIVDGDNGDNGVLIKNGASLNTVQANLLSGNSFAGVSIGGAETNKNYIIQNLIGTNRNCTGLISNKDDGINISGAYANEIIDNVLCGAGIGFTGGNNGIEILDGTARENIISRNFIGTNSNGDSGLGNGFNGIQIKRDAHHNTVGPDNVISGNWGHGVLLDGDTFEEGTSADHNVVFGNQIGLVISDGESVDLGNNWSGVMIYDNAASNTIGPGNVISGNTDNGIHISSPGSTNNKVIGNIIGLTANGATALGNGNSGVVLNSANNTVGGIELADRNVISGNVLGVVIQGPDANDNQVAGNYLGTNATGTVAQPNTNHGVFLGDGTGNEIGPGNLISGNDIFGVLIIDNAHENQVMGNLIGTNYDGSSAIGNDIGVHVIRGQNNTIGGDKEGEGNVISGNNTGILIYGDSPSEGAPVVMASGNKIMGNLIGTTPDGKAVLGNAHQGIRIGNNTGNTIIGGLIKETRNVISGNLSGINIHGNANANNVIQGNYIGLDKDANKNLGNTDGPGIAIYEGSSYNLIGGKEAGAGNFISGSSLAPGIELYGPGTYYNEIYGNVIGTNRDREEGCSNMVGVSIFNGASYNLIGGVEDGEGNVIAFNEEEGVVIYNEGENEEETSGNSILSNSIFDNGKIGIDLGYDGVTDNDNGDGDGSPNNLQNYPVLESIGFSQGEVAVSGYINSTAGTAFLLQFFANYLGDYFLNGEGETYLGSITVVTSPNDTVSFEATFQISGFVGQVITATATDPNGNTSEFSRFIGGVKDQVLAPINQPFEYRVNEEVVPGIPSDNDLQAIQDAFQTWEDVSTSDLDFDYMGTTTARNASATDGINLVSFRDESFPFSPGVLAVSAKTLRMKPSELDPDIMVAEILDADIVFNPEFTYSQDMPFGIVEEGINTSCFDIQGLATHEIGHVFGMIHTGVPTSTMFYMLDFGSVEERSLELDDIAWASYRYQNDAMESSFGYISGEVLYGEIGDEGSHPPVAGALVLAIDTETLEQIHAYTDADGTYKVPIPLNGQASNDYWIHIQPLDGDVFRTRLLPGNISPYIFSNTIYTDFPDEFYNGDNEGRVYNPDGTGDNPNAGTPITVESGKEKGGINLITNVDLTPPEVVEVKPADVSTDVEIVPDIVITFSEDINEETLSEETCFLQTGSKIIGGTYLVASEDLTKVFMRPVESLEFETIYTLNINGVEDFKGNSRTSYVASSFTTKARVTDTDPPQLTDIIPKDGTDGIFVSSDILMFFSEPMDKETFDAGFNLSVGSDPVAGEPVWDSENKTVTYKPDKILLEDTEYTMTVSSALTDMAGNSLDQEEPTVVIFTTIDAVAPRFTLVGPVDGAKEVSVETPVLIDFSEPINKATITSSSFYLTYPDDTKVPGTFKFLKEDTRVVFRPDKILDFSQDYKIHLTSAIYDMSEKSLPLVDIPVLAPKFTTDSKESVPHIVYIDPISGGPGSKVVISGKNFETDISLISVQFNTAEAYVEDATISKITVVVPGGVTTGQVTLTVKEVAADNSKKFNVIPLSEEQNSAIANASTGSRPRSVAISPNAGYAYITNSGDDNVSVINLSPDSQEEATSIDVGNEPVDIAINSDGTRAYVSNYLDNTVSVLNLDPENPDYPINTWMKDISVGLHPLGIAVSPNQMVYVANEQSQDVTVIDVNPASGGFDHAVANASTGTKNRSVAITPNAALALITGDNGVNIIDLNPAHDLFNSVIANASSGSKTRSVAITPNAALAIATTEDGEVLIINIFPGSTSFGEAIANVSSGSKARSVTISPNAQYIYITNMEEGKVYVYELDYSAFGTIDNTLIPEFESSSYPGIGLNEVDVIVIPDINGEPAAPDAIAIDPMGEIIVATNNTEQGGAIIIGIEQVSIDPIHTLADLITSVYNSLRTQIIPVKAASKMLVDLDKTLDRINSDQLESAIDHLENFIERVERYISRGEIPEALGNAWLDAAYRIREQLLKDLEAQQSLLKGSGATGSGFRTTNDSNIAANSISELQREGFLKLENRPNPFSNHTQVYFEIPDKSEACIPVIIRVFNINGQVMKTLVHMDMEPGAYSVIWNSDLDDGGLVPDGIYLLELMTPGERKAIRISVVK